MDILKGIFGNKMLVNMAMGKFKDFMTSEGITAVVIRMDKTATESDGVRFDAHKRAIAIVEEDDIVKIRAIMDCVPAIQSMTAEEIYLLVSMAQSVIANRNAPQQLGHSQMGPKGGKSNA